MKTLRAAGIAIKEGARPYDKVELTYISKSEDAFIYKVALFTKDGLNFAEFAAAVGIASREQEVKAAVREGAHSMRKEFDNLNNMHRVLPHNVIEPYAYAEARPDGTGPAYPIYSMRYITGYDGAYVKETIKRLEDIHSPQTLVEKYGLAGKRLKDEAKIKLIREAVEILSGRRTADVEAISIISGLSTHQIYKLDHKEKILETLGVVMFKDARSRSDIYVEKVISERVPAIEEALTGLEKDRSVIIDMTKLAAAMVNNPEKPYRISHGDLGEWIKHHSGDSRVKEVQERIFRTTMPGRIQSAINDLRAQKRRITDKAVRDLVVSGGIEKARYGSWKTKNDDKHIAYLRVEEIDGLLEKLKSVEVSADTDVRTLAEAVRIENWLETLTKIAGFAQQDIVEYRERLERIILTGEKRVKRLVKEREERIGAQAAKIEQLIEGIGRIRLNAGMDVETLPEADEINQLIAGLSEYGDP
ncbi:MAG: hypothetical protein Q8N91_04040, partial [Candidatus Omnitrophota bacterium]|nr:hypothetical protein [Candidatus Omnitrophota bacterium]